MIAITFIQVAGAFAWLVFDTRRMLRAIDEQFRFELAREVEAYGA